MVKAIEFEHCDIHRDEQDRLILVTRVGDGIPLPPEVRTPMRRPCGFESRSTRPTRKPGSRPIRECTTPRCLPSRHTERSSSTSREYELSRCRELCAALVPLLEPGALPFANVPR